MASFQLPDPAGRAGGACTSAMLKILYADHQQTGTDLSYQEVLLQMRDILKSASYTQIPQLSSSRPLDIKEKFDLVPSDITGTKRAVMVGINYVGTYATPGSRTRRNPNLNLLQLQNCVLTFPFHYLGHNPGELSGCHNDVLNMKRVHYESPWI